MPRASIHGISGNPLFPAAVQLRKSDEVRSVGSRDTVIKLAWAGVWQSWPIFTIKEAGRQFTCLIGT
jgi:hypothetical protein